MEYDNLGSELLVALVENIEYTGNPKDTIKTKDLLRILHGRKIPDLPKKFRAHLKKDVLSILKDPENTKKPKTYVVTGGGLLRYIRVIPDSLDDENDFF